MFYIVLHKTKIKGMESNFDIVTPEWLTQKIKGHNMTLEEFASYFEDSRGNISAYSNGSKSLSKLRKTAFYYFFLYMECEQSGDREKVKKIKQVLNE